MQNHLTSLLNIALLMEIVLENVYHKYVRCTGNDRNNFNYDIKYKLNIRRLQYNIDR